MCGRYYLTIKLEKLIYKFNITNSEIDYSPQKEIFPSQKAPVIYQNEDNKPVLKLFKWGFNPGYSNKLIINARSETVNRKKLFRKSFLEKRCLIPASGFFEWAKADNKKIKYNITIKNSNLFSFAGLYDDFTDDKGDNIRSYVIITTDANKNIGKIHDRMPVIINKENENVWLDNSHKKPEDLLNILRPYPDKKIKLNNDSRQLQFDF